MFAMVKMYSKCSLIGNNRVAYSPFFSLFLGTSNCIIESSFASLPFHFGFQTKILEPNPISFFIWNRFGARTANVKLMNWNEHDADKLDGQRLIESNNSITLRPNWILTILTASNERKIRQYQKEIQPLVLFLCITRCGDRMFNGQNEIYHMRNWLWISQWIIWFRFPLLSLHWLNTLSRHIFCRVNAFNCTMLLRWREFHMLRAINSKHSLISKLQLKIAQISE